MINRSEAPELKEVKHISFIQPETVQVSKEVELYWLREVSDEAVKIDFFFEGGSIRGRKLISKLVGDLLFSGTNEKSSAAITESIDRLGGFTSVEVSSEEATVSVLGLKENIDEISAIVIDAIQNASFPEKEIKQAIQRKKQGLAVSLQKVSTVARRNFVREILGNTPYGQLTELEDFDRVDRDELVEFHRNHYSTGLQKIAVVGNLEKAQIDRLVTRVKTMAGTAKKSEAYNFHYTPDSLHIEKKEALQTAIRIGRILFNKNHEDYIDFTVLNTILGGYFGSRLMTTVREEKGYTYGIGSGVAQMLPTGYFFISTEVGKDVKEDALKTIREELEKLQKVPVNERELLLVRNYSLGQLLKGSDGPFAMMDRYLAVKKYGKNLDYYDEIIQRINTVSAERLRALAEKYLKWEDLLVVTAG